jgi:hypothetical protein
VNLFRHRWTEGEWPAVTLANIALLGAFAGYAGGGGLVNSTYSNFVRDQGWGMGRLVGAIPSAVGGKKVTLSHTGKVFPADAANLARWRGWWRRVLVDQVWIWAPGCFMGMALPALLSLEFAPHSSLHDAPQGLEWAQAVISADGLRRAPGFPAGAAQALWVAALLAGAMVMLPSQMSIVDDFSRRWTDAAWTANRRVRETMAPGRVKVVYYTILSSYVAWSFACAYLFSTYGTPKAMTIIIANLLLWLNHRLLPRPLRPRWYHSAGVVACGIFYLALAALVFLRGLFGA